MSREACSKRCGPFWSMECMTLLRVASLSRCGTRSSIGLAESQRAQQRSISASSSANSIAHALTFAHAPCSPLTSRAMCFFFLRWEERVPRSMASARLNYLTWSRGHVDSTHLMHLLHASWAEEERGTLYIVLGPRNAKHVASH